METTSIEQNVIVPASPEEVYAAYTDPEKHAEFTRAEATGVAKVGGEMTAWDGYILGKYLELEPDKKIVQEWWTTEWPEDMKPSRLEITLRPVEKGTEVNLVQTDVPLDQAPDYDQGWHDYYWKPMCEYFRK